MNTLSLFLKGQYYVFVWGMSDALFDSIKSGLSVWRWDILTYSIVDLKENNGKGKVITKMNYLLEHDDLAASQMSAVRHANCRDWWLVKPHLRKHRFYIYLVTPDVIISQPIQEFDSPTLANGVIGQSNFAPDGSLCVITSEFYDHFTQVNKFDRCTGLRSKYITIPWVYDSTFTAWSVVGNACFSPNNQFLYLINNVHIVQFDFINNESIELNPSNTSNPNGNDLAYNSSDGIIYIGNFNHTSNSISYIEHPDKKGLAANYCKLCYQTKNNNTASPPNNPNYELGVLKGSPCDTIKAPFTINTIIKIYPNPVNDIQNIKLPTGTKKVSLVIYNMLGEVVLKQNIAQIKDNKLEVSVIHLARSLYSIKIEADDVSFVGKYVKG